MHEQASIFFIFENSKKKEKKKKYYACFSPEVFSFSKMIMRFINLFFLENVVKPIIHLHNIIQLVHQTWIYIIQTILIIPIPNSISFLNAVPQNKLPQSIFSQYNSPNISKHCTRNYKDKFKVTTLFTGFKLA